MVLNPISKLERLDWMQAGKGLRLGKKEKEGSQTHSSLSQEPRQTAISPGGRAGVLRSVALGQALSACFPLLRGCNLAPLTLLTQGPENSSESPNRQHHLLSTSPPQLDQQGWRYEWLNLGQIGRNQSRRYWEWKPRRGCPAMLSITTLQKRKSK